jgi:hypothetical protein
MVPRGCRKISKLRKTDRMGEREEGVKRGRILLSPNKLPRVDLPPITARRISQSVALPNLTPPTSHTNPQNNGNVHI